MSISPPLTASAPPPPPVPPRSFFSRHPLLVGLAVLLVFALYAAGLRRV